MFTHPCLKCGISYEDSEPDAYYCVTCLTERKQLAATLDKKFNTIGQVPNGALQEFEASAKIVKAPNGRTIAFAKA